MGLGWNLWVRTGKAAAECMVQALTGKDRTGPAAVVRDDRHGRYWIGSTGPEWIIKDGLSMERNGLAALVWTFEVRTGLQWSVEAAAEAVEWQ